ncbi:hypothetical protein Dimus_000658 [Dionaea muscipula]
MWWLGVGANRRRDDENEEVNNESAPAENVEMNQEEVFEWEAVDEEAELQGQQAEIKEKEVEAESSGSGEKFFDVVEEVDERSVDEVQIPSVNATEVIVDEDDNDEGAIVLANQEVLDAAQRDDDEDVVRKDADDDDEDDEEDNMPMSSRIEALRRSDDDDDDNVVLSMKYQTTLQELILVYSDLEVVGMNSAEMEVKVEGNSLLVVGDDGEVYGTDDADVLIDFVIETTVDNMLVNISDKVDMELAEELAKELEDKEVADKANAGKAKTYRRRKRANKS